VTPAVASTTATIFLISHFEPKALMEKRYTKKALVFQIAGSKRDMRDLMMMSVGMALSSDIRYA